MKDSVQKAPIAKPAKMKANQISLFQWCNDVWEITNQIIFHTFLKKSRGLWTRLSTVNQRRSFPIFLREGAAVHRLVILASSGIKRHPIPFRWFLGVACEKIWGSFGVGDHFGSCLGRFWGSFGVGDHFGSRTNLTIRDLFRSICVCAHLSGFFFSAKERCRKLLIELLSSTILNIAWLIDW